MKEQGIVVFDVHLIPQFNYARFPLWTVNTRLCLKLTSDFVSLISPIHNHYTNENYAAEDCNFNVFFTVTNEYLILNTVDRF